MEKGLDRSKIGIFTLPREGMSLVEGIAYTKRMGLNFFEPLACGELSTPNLPAARELRKAAREAHVQMPCLSVVSDLAGDNRRQQARRLKEYAQLAAEMGIPRLHHTLIPQLSPREDRLSFAAALEQVVPLAQEVYDEAQSCAVDCVYEEQGLYFNGCDRFGAFLEALNRPAGVVLDFGNILFAGEELAQFAGKFIKKVVHVHVKDYVIAAMPSNIQAIPLGDGAYAVPAILGQGVLAVKETLKILGQGGYMGCLMLEHGVVGDGETEQRRCVEQLIRWIRDIGPDGEEAQVENDAQD